MINKLKTIKKPYKNNHGPNFKDITGKQFGLLTVIKLSEKRGKNNQLYWDCKCECGNILAVLSVSLLSKHTKSCGCLRKRIGKKNPLWRGYGEISGQWFALLRNSAKIRRIKINFTRKYIWDLFLKQNRQCALSKLKIKFSKSGDELQTTACLDRIDSKKGYVKGNVQWVHKHINQSKLDFEQEYFINMCKTIFEYQNSKNK